MVTRSGRNQSSKQVQQAASIAGTSKEGARKKNERHDSVEETASIEHTDIDSNPSLSKVNTLTDLWLANLPGITIDIDIGTWTQHAIEAISNQLRQEMDDQIDAFEAQARGYIASKTSG